MQPIQTATCDSERPAVRALHQAVMMWLLSWEASYFPPSPTQLSDLGCSEKGAPSVQVVNMAKPPLHPLLYYMDQIGYLALELCMWVAFGMASSQQYTQGSHILLSFWHPAPPWCMYIIPVAYGCGCSASTHIDGILAISWQDSERLFIFSPWTINTAVAEAK